MMIENNPFATVRQLAAGYILPRCLHVVADLGVADALDETPRTAAELAPLVGADPGALRRVMSLLAAHGVFETQGNRFRHSPASRLLLNDHPQSMRAFVQAFGRSINWSVYQAMEYSIRTGQPATDEVLPGGMWAYLAEQPEDRRIFDAAMVSKTHAHTAAILSAYDFSAFGLIGDIGGGRGHLLRAILDATPSTRGVLFDLPDVIDQVGDLSSERLTLQAGDFFKDSLPFCDAYILMEVIHDWNDDQAAAILKAVRRAAPVHARLLMIEELVPNHQGPHWSKVLDVHMMTMLGGMQRTWQQYEALLGCAGFAFQRQIDTEAGISVLEAVPNETD